MLPLAGYLECVAWLYELASRVCGLVRTQMYGRRARLSSIPERSEAEEEQTVTKWVPKQKHEVLKAKYKCLKKLFQVYDASLVNMLPDPYVKPEICPSKESRRSKESDRSHKSTKKKRKTHRRRADGEKTSTDSEKDCSCVAGALMKDLKIKKCTLGPTLTDQVGVAESKRQFSNVKSIKAESSDFSSEASLSAESRCSVNCAQAPAQRAPSQPPPLQQVCFLQPKLTKMQILKYRLFGHRPKAYRYNMEQVQSMSDPTMSSCAGAAPAYAAASHPRRRLRLRRHRAGRARSCDALADMSHPVIMGYVQSVQQSCLLDTTVRLCPIPGCKMALNGIINYNDHLRLCHFPERKYVCHYCHEGFESEEEKILHENGHIGIFGSSKASIPKTAAPAVLPEKPKAAGPTGEHDKDIQCDVISEEKLKKIVSYFDRISTGDGGFDSSRRAGNDQGFGGRCDIDPTSRRVEYRRLSSKSCGYDLCRARECDRKNSESIAIACKMCGELFQFRKQLNCHMDEEHGLAKRKSKFHSVCALPLKSSLQCMPKDGELNVDTIDSCKARASSSDQAVRATREAEPAKSVLSLDYDPSTNIVYYNTTSMESICNRKPSAFDKFVKKVKSVRSFQTARWESETKVIHV